MSRRTLALLCLSGLISGCAAAALEGIAVRSAAVGAAEALAIRGAAPAAAEAMAGRAALAGGSRAIASRMIVSDPLLGVAAGRGVLRKALFELTSGGTRPAMLAVERDGLIRAGAENLARLRPATGEIVSQGRVHGILADGYLFEVQNGVRGDAIAKLRGFISARNAPIRTSAVGGYSIQRSMVVEVIRVENGRYLIRLPGGVEEWVGPELVALLIVASESGDQCPGADGVVVRANGESVAFDHCVSNGPVLELTTGEGKIIVDRAEVKEIIPGSLSGEVERTAIRLADGNTVFGLVEDAGNSLLIYDEGGGVIIADRSEVLSVGPALLGSPG